MKKLNKIGILGGTFNPIHNGHIALGRAAYEQYDLDEVWVMVSKTPPHKQHMDIPAAEIRSDMVKLAIADYPYLCYSDFELQRDGFIYTADTLTLLCRQFPKNQYYFIVGGDSLRSFDCWYHPEVILDKAILLAAGRDAWKDEVLLQCIARTKEKYHGEIYPVELPAIPYSSSEIRECTAAGKDISHMLDKKVVDYIQTHHLYQ